MMNTCSFIFLLLSDFEDKGRPKSFTDSDLNLNIKQLQESITLALITFSTPPL